MRTSKPVSTITYNSPQFLVGRLDELIDAKKITFYAFIYHFGEIEKNGSEGKNHIHLYILPAKTIQTDDLILDLREMDMTNPGAKPLKPQPFRNSKRFGDWYLYCIHDPAYLASKLESRQIQYTCDQFYTSDPDFFLQLISEIQADNLITYEDMRSYIREGLSFARFMTDYRLPFTQVAFYEKVFKILLDEHIGQSVVERNGRPNPVDPK